MHGEVLKILLLIGDGIQKLTRPLFGSPEEQIGSEIIGIGLELQGL